MTTYAYAPTNRLADVADRRPLPEIELDVADELADSQVQPTARRDETSENRAPGF